MSSRLMCPPHPQAGVGETLIHTDKERLTAIANTRSNTNLIIALCTEQPVCKGAMAELWLPGDSHGLCISHGLTCTSYGLPGTHTACQGLTRPELHIIQPSRDSHGLCTSYGLPITSTTSHITPNTHTHIGPRLSIIPSTLSSGEPASYTALQGLGITWYHLVSSMFAPNQGIL
ncbi:hypothetical protein GWK47_019586 [Chionoecetes opilio]|uniref:Uncharacterized protein n=1 Tax=Chionoecetes opilio TaxID=41210 RepID=A0A8J4XPT4_CHIOP|nr:hypothetical protein GWK47_019586 [Chionoecetes opilio]